MGRDVRQYKQQAAEEAVTFIASGMVVGLGHGSTAIFAICRIAKFLKNKRLKTILSGVISRCERWVAACCLSLYYGLLFFS
jgi:ribose 5-phosphate isomerase